MTRRLFVSTVPDDFNPGHDIALGPWCFVTKEKVYPEWESYPFQPDTFPTRQAFCEASDLTRTYANSLIPELTKKLNAINHTNHSERFWRFLIFPFLISLVQTTWERQCRMEQFVAKYGNTALSVQLIPASVQLFFPDTTTFVSAALEPFYNHWIYARLIEKIAPSAWIITYLEEKSCIDQACFHPRPEKIKNWKKFFLEKLSGNRCFSVHRMDKFTALLFSVLLSLKRPTILSAPRYCSKIPGTNQFRWLIDFDQLIEMCLPKCFLSIATLSSKPQQGIKKGKINLMGSFPCYEEKRKYKLALRQESGEYAIFSQHGSCYGDSECFGFMGESEYRQEKFISWGWLKHDCSQGNIIPLPSPFLSKMKRAKPENYMLLVGTHAAFSVLRLQSAPQAVQWVQYLKEKIVFLKQLSPILQDVLYRPYNSPHFSLNDTEYVLDKIPSIRICEGGTATRRFHQKVLTSKLIALDHPGTTLNITLAANVPTVCFWNDEAWAMCSEARPYYDQLQKVGILHNNATSAAQHVLAIWDDVEGWWKQPDVQAARSAWAHQFARTSRHWRWEWMKALWRL